jgi:hypothetical protein
VANDSAGLDVHAFVKPIVFGFRFSTPVEIGTNARATARVGEVAPLRIITDSLSRGRVGVPYTTQMVATGGRSPITWSNFNNTLPTGLSINATTGLISGTPTVAVSRNITIFARSGLDSVFRSYPIVISPTIEIVTISLGAADSGRFYSAQLNARNALSEPAWTVVSGSLPPGLNVSSAGLISGIPTRPGGYSFRIQASASGESATRDFGILVRGTNFEIVLRINPRVTNFLYTASVRASVPNFFRRDTGGPCAFDTGSNGSQQVVCRASVPRGTTVTLTLETNFFYFYRWVLLPNECPTQTPVCTFVADVPDAQNEKVVNLDLNI